MFISRSQKSINKKIKKEKLEKKWKKSKTISNYNNKWQGTDSNGNLMGIIEERWDNNKNNFKTR